ncbi:MAG: biopolymer transport protein ExbD [Planctomycetota bacterium]|jgi:biopolymer transport protein ExbD
MSNIQELQDEVCELEMTPMIDVTFLLLIFFIVTLKFKVLEGKLTAYLPKDVGVNSSDAEPIEKVAILLRPRVEGTKMSADGKSVYNDPTGQKRFIWGPDRVLEYSVGSTKTTNLDEITKRLTKIYKDRDDEAPATIDARPGTCYGDVVPLLDAAINAGFTDITFVGAYPENIK